MQHWLALEMLGQAVAEVQLQQGDSQQVPVLCTVAPQQPAVVIVQLFGNACAGKAREQIAVDQP